MYKHTKEEPPATPTREYPIVSLAAAAPVGQYSPTTKESTSEALGCWNTWAGAIVGVRSPEIIIICVLLSSRNVDYYSAFEWFCGHYTNLLSPLHTIQALPSVCGRNNEFDQSVLRNNNNHFNSVRQ